MKQPRSTDWRIAVPGGEVSARYDASPAGQRAVFVCAHGAGGHMADRGMVSVGAALGDAGLGIIRFNFLYREKKSGRPDPMPALKECVASVVAHARSELAPAPLVIGGRSMGGRAASMLAADGFECDGLLLLAYPLHPAGQPEKLRDAHLPAIRVPVLCLNGTRDTLCDRNLMERALTPVRTAWTMHWLEGADHSFHVLKSSGRTNGEVLAEVSAAARSWIDSLKRPADR